MTLKWQMDRFLAGLVLIRSQKSIRSIFAITTQNLSTDFLPKIDHLQKLKTATGLVIFIFIIFIVWLIRKRQIAQQELQKRLELQAKRYYES